MSESTDASYITVVTGLPRSGTSMLMQMLHAGGMEILTDGVRQADIDNPRGYYELERAKRIKEDGAWLEEARGRAFKLVSLLVPCLPPAYAYRVLLVTRNIREVLASQRKMLERLGRTGAQVADEQLAAVFGKQLKELRDWMTRQSHVLVLELDHAEIVSNPAAVSNRLAEFLELSLDREKMAAAVDPELYRCKVTV